VALKRARGFTLIEVLTVVALTGIVIAIAIPVYRNYIVMTETVDVISALKAVELEVRAPITTTGGLHVCTNALVNPQNLQSRYVRLDIHDIPNDPLNPLSEQGYAAALRVTATLDSEEGRNGIAVAKAFFEEVKSALPNIVRNELLTDSFVTFDVMISEFGQPYCDISQTALARAALAAAPSGAVAATGAINRPPVLSHGVRLGTVAEDTAISIDVAKLLAGGYDADGDALVVSSVTANSGTITGDSASGYFFHPAKDFNGRDVEIHYKVTDGVDGSDAVSGVALLDVSPVVDAPSLSLALSVAQEVLQTNTDGRAVMPRVDTGGDMREVSLEFSVIGRSAGSATGGSGPVIFNYGTSTDNNMISAWRPNNLNIAFFGRGYDAGIDLTDGNSHRVTITWRSASGELAIYDNGVLSMTHAGVAQGRSIPGDGYAVLGQKMNRPATSDGWNVGEHYNGQILGATMLNQARDGSQVAAQPLYVNGRAQGAVMDVRSQGGQLRDNMGGGLDMQGDFSIDTMPVDTDLALVPPGSRLTISVQASLTEPGSTLKSVHLKGLPSSMQISDNAGHSGAASSDIAQWNMAAISTRLPAGLKANLSLRVVATAMAADGSTAEATVTKMISMTP
jgi:prepilin-type N-terminal cleavage/methylation domain-containing protein